MNISIDKKAEIKFDSLIAFLQNIIDNLPNNSQIPAKKFKKIAKIYFKQMQILLATNMTNKQKIMAYAKALSHLNEHILFLSKLSYAYHLNLETEMQLFANMMSIIGVRANAPRICGFPSQDFKLIQFDYSNEVIVGIPLTYFKTPFLDIIWHEVGGYKYNNMVKQGKIEKIINEMLPKKSLNLLSIVYKQSSKSYYSTTLEPKKWQQQWLVEFFEDLFAVQALGGNFIEALTKILVAKYPLFYLGDTKHPPANLRVHTALAYLKLLNVKHKNKRYDANLVTKKLNKIYGKDLLTICHYKLNISKVDYIAQLIAKVYYETAGKLPTKEKKLCEALHKSQENLSPYTYRKLTKRVKKLSKDIKLKHNKSNYSNLEQQILLSNNPVSLLRIQFANIDLAAFPYFPIIESDIPPSDIF
jgi:hypothetical protein